MGLGLVGTERASPQATGSRRKPLELVPSGLASMGSAALLPLWSGLRARGRGGNPLVQPRPRVLLQRCLEVSLKAPWIRVPMMPAPFQRPPPVTKPGSIGILTRRPLPLSRIKKKQLGGGRSGRTTEPKSIQVAGLQQDSSRSTLEPGMQLTATLARTKLGLGSQKRSPGPRPTGARNPTASLSPLYCCSFRGPMRRGCKPSELASKAEEPRRFNPDRP